MRHSGVQAPTAARYLHSLCQSLVNDGCYMDDLLTGTALDEQVLQTAGQFVDHDPLDQVLGNIEQHTNEHFPGLRLGHHLNVSAHGVVGYAGLTSSSTAAAIEVACRYFPLITSLATLKLEPSRYSLELIITPTAGISERAERFVLQTLLASFDVMGSFLVGNLGLRADLGFPKQAELRTRLGEAIEVIAFDQPRHRFVIPKDRLSGPYALADQTAHAQALAQCERELQVLRNRLGLAGRILEALKQAGPSTVDQETLASQLGISSRTLHRRLLDEGTSFRKLSQQAMISQARLYLEHERLSVTEVAYRLGYRDSANFTRAFRKATGMTPSASARRGRREKRLKGSD